MLPLAACEKLNHLLPVIRKAPQGDTGTRPMTASPGKTPLEPMTIFVAKRIITMDESLPDATRRRRRGGESSRSGISNRWPSGAKVEK
ncbi:MAG: hypothetical protein R3E48_21355 [Burkholderiaceae bacterium]